MQDGELRDAGADARERPGLERVAKGVSRCGEVGHDDEALARDGVGGGEPDGREEHLDCGGDVVEELGLAAVDLGEGRVGAHDGWVEAAFDADGGGEVRGGRIVCDGVEELGGGAVDGVDEGERRDGVVEDG